MAAFSFLPQNFGRCQGPTNGSLSFYECRSSGNHEVVGSAGHSNPTICKRICILQSQALTPKNHHCLTFTTFNSLFFALLCSAYHFFIQTSEGISIWGCLKSLHRKPTLPLIKYRLVLFTLQQICVNSEISR